MFKYIVGGGAPEKKIVKCVQRCHSGDMINKEN